MATPSDPSESSSRPRAWPRVLLVLGRVALGSIFLYAAYSKLYFNGGLHLGGYQFFFGLAIHSVKKVPGSVVPWVGPVFPWVALFVCALLSPGCCVRWGG